MDAFDVALWTPDPVPERAAPSQAAQPLPPVAATGIKLQLVGIVLDTSRDGSTSRRAALYDPASDSLVLLDQDAAINGLTVRSVGADMVVLADAVGGTTRLHLRPEGVAP